LPPDQAPEAEQALALVADHVKVDARPEFTLLGFAVRDTTGAGLATVTVAVCVAEPLGPVQVSPYSVVFVSAPVDQVPLVATAPLHPPDAVHAPAWTAFQASVELPPLATVVGDAVRVIEGGGIASTATCTDLAAVPPEPVQLKV
jgi:hypothetical protein